MVRIHPEDRGPIFFGPSPGSAPKNRFDAPGGEYRALYAAERLEGAFVETILRKPGGRVLRRAFVQQRAWSVLRTQRPLSLAKVYDEGLQVYGIDAGTIGIDDYAESRALALALYHEFPVLYGLAYRSRYNNGEICYALFDRVAAADLSPVKADAFRDHPDRVDGLMSLYGAAFDTSAAIS